MLPSIIRKKNRNNLDVVAQGKILPSLRDVFNIILTFMLITFSRIFFRSSTMSQSFLFIKNIFSTSLFDKVSVVVPVSLLFFILFFTIIEWIGREQQHGLEQFALKWTKWIRWLFYFVLMILILAFSGNAQEFFYFQF